MGIFLGNANLIIPSPKMGEGAAARRVRVFKAFFTLIRHFVPPSPACGRRARFGISRASWYRKILSILSLLIFCHSTAFAHICEPLAPQIDDLINKHFANAMFGLIVQDAETGCVLYEKSANTVFVPSSAAKLFSAAAALHELTPEFRFLTTIKYEKNKLKGGVLAGAVALEFKGDPSLRASSLKKLVASLKKAKITTITGNLIIDDSCFQGNEVGAGWSADDLPWYYASPVSAIIINENKINIAINPAKKLGNPAVVALAGKEHKQHFKLHSTVRTVNSASRSCGLRAEMDQDNVIHVKGCWPKTKKASYLKLSIQNTRKFAKDIILAALQEQHIKFKGKILYAKAPKNLCNLASQRSAPLASLLSKVLGNSNNLYADAITKTLGAKLYNFGSFKTGVLAIKDVLQEPTGINFADINLVDGSGLSRYNLISPHQFARLLYTMYHSPHLKKPFANALALAGVKGTLRYRLKAFDTYENVNAKTGSMTGISALAGYIKTSSQRTLIFTMLVNNTLLPLKNVKKIEDEFCQLLVNY